MGMRADELVAFRDGLEEFAGEMFKPLARADQRVKGGRVPMSPGWSEGEGDGRDGDTAAAEDRGALSRLRVGRGRRAAPADGPAAGPGRKSPALRCCPSGAEPHQGVRRDAPAGWKVLL